MDLKWSIGIITFISIIFSAHAQSMTCADQHTTEAKTWAQFCKDDTDQKCVEATGTAPSPSCAPKACADQHTTEAKTWAKFCQDDRDQKCVEAPGGATSPYCAPKTCADFSGQGGASWQAFCDGLNRLCTVPDGVTAPTKCGACKTDFVGATDDDTMCTGKVKTCKDIQADSITWESFCANTNQHCQEDATSGPKCAVRCIGIPFIPNMDYWGSCHDASEGESCYFKCYLYHKLIGSDQLTCQSFGWSSPFPTCQVATCADIYSPTFGQRMDAFCAAQKKECMVSSDGSTVTCGACLPGHKRGPSEYDPCVVENMCSGIPFIPNMDFWGSCSKAWEGETCEFKCLPNHRLIGSHKVTCLSNGWSSPFPTCQAITCKDLVSDLWNTTTWWGNCYEAMEGEFCLLECLSGFRFTAGSNGIVTCGPYGWTSPPPECVAITTCPKVGFLLNGFTEGNCSQAEPGDQCVVRCKEGFSLRGQDSLTCNEDGSWDSQIPVCAIKETHPCHEERDNGKSWGAFCHEAGATCVDSGTKTLCKCGLSKTFDGHQCREKSPCATKHASGKSWSFFCKSIGGVCEASNMHPQCACHGEQRLSNGVCRELTSCVNPKEDGTEWNKFCRDAGGYCTTIGGYPACTCIYGQVFKAGVCNGITAADF